MRPALIVNPVAGEGRAERLGLLGLAAERGFDVRVSEDGDLPRLCEAAIADGADVLCIAGGDGSHAAGAAVAIAHDVAFVPAPCGTLNHFARDAGFDPGAPLDALDAVEAPERRIDVGAAGGRVFLNAVSLGLYAEMVRERDYRQRKLRVGRRVVRRELASGEHLDLRFDGPDGPVRERVPLLLVFNNALRLTAPRIGRRDRLDGGALQVATLVLDGRRHISAVMLRAALSQRLDERDGWQTWLTRELVVDSARPSIHAAIDGEPIEFDTPLRIEIRPAALRLRGGA